MQNKMIKKATGLAAAWLLALLIWMMPHAMAEVLETGDGGAALSATIQDVQPSAGSTVEPTSDPSPTVGPAPDAPTGQREPVALVRPVPSPDPAAASEPARASDRPADSIPRPIPEPSQEPGSQGADLPMESALDAPPAIAPVPTATPGPDSGGPEGAKAAQRVGGGLKLTSNRPRGHWSGVAPADDGGMPVPMLFQSHYRTILCRYDGIPRSVSTSGCNVTCVAMVAAYLTGEQRSPEQLFSWAVRSNLYHGNGLGHPAMAAVAAKCGVRGTWIGRDGAAVIEALKAGKPVIAHMGAGLFAKSGHYIVLRGVTEDGKILVNDPNSARMSELAYPIKAILRESKTSAPFMVCEKM